MSIVHIKLLSGDILALDIESRQISVLSLTTTVIKAYPSLFKNTPRYCFHWFREENELDFLDKVYEGDFVAVFINPISHIFVYRGDNGSILFKDTNGSRSGEFKDLFIFFGEDELERLNNTYYVEQPQLVIDYDSLLYMFEPSEDDSPEYVFTREFVLDRLGLSFTPPSVEDYAEVFGWASVPY